ncbi:uncharacterized protein LOC114749029 [Neltuma alba]|uniref:uncharacterized protein LOC114749029 n=1 Tax=Neltuma alba TaxID=207710 RepID=UPI0010A579E4|nr:uncharacterized protein LOC114749029 [Prosopis alba]
MTLFRVEECRGEQPFASHASSRRPKSLQRQIAEALRTATQASVLFPWKLRLYSLFQPKIEYFQLLGFHGPELGELLSKNGILLGCSLNKTLVPSVKCVRQIVNNKKDLIKVLQRYAEWIIPRQQRVLDNAAFFKSCGIVGSQLSFLIKKNARLFAMRESLVRNYVSRAVNLGFSVNSRMLVHGLRTISSMSIVKFNRKLEIIQSCGFSRDEAMQMFRRTPGLLGRSETRLKFKIEVFLDKIMLPKSLLVNNPVILMLNMEKRVIPRWRVLKLLISKNLLMNNPSFLRVLHMREEKFLEKYIS